MTDDYRPRCYPQTRVQLGMSYLYEPPEGGETRPRACQVVSVSAEGQMCVIFCPPVWQEPPMMVDDVPSSHLFCVGNDNYDDHGFLLSCRAPWRP